MKGTSISRIPRSESPSGLAAEDLEERNKHSNKRRSYCDSIMRHVEAQQDVFFDPSFRPMPPPVPKFEATASNPNWTGLFNKIDERYQRDT